MLSKRKRRLAFIIIDYNIQIQLDKIIPIIGFVNSVHFKIWQNNFNAFFYLYDTESQEWSVEDIILI